MTGYLGKATNWDDDVVGRKALDERNAQWGEIPGKIVTFDKAKQTAKVLPLYRPLHNGKPIDMPELLEVPVRFMRAGPQALTIPVKEGAHVALRPQMRSSENYHTEGEGSPSDQRSFNLSDMEAFLDGGESLKDPIKNFDNENIHFRANEDGTRGLKMDKEGRIKHETAEGDMTDVAAQVAEKTAQVATLLGTETLTHAVQYAQLGAELTALAAKLRGVVMP